MAKTYDSTQSGYSFNSNNFQIPAINFHTSSKANWFKSIGASVFVAIGYIDPGNWATDIAGGSRAGYTLLSIILFSTLVAILLQVFSARLGIATGKDLAQLSKTTWPRLAWPSWFAAEIAIIATDLAEVLGAAIALHLLFSIPISVGVMLTILDVFIFLALGMFYPNFLNRFIALLLLIIGCGLVYEIVLAQPKLNEIMQGFIPSRQIVVDSQLLYLAIGVIGATIMPHNLYLHSNLVTSNYRKGDKNKVASKLIWNTVWFLGAAMLLNIALIIVSASVFHSKGHLAISELAEAHTLLSPLLGTNMAALVFAIMLLASGQSASITGTMAGQVVMNGYLHFKISPWARRLLTRSVSLIPAFLAISYFGEHCVANLLITSQVLLSLQLPLAILPLLLLTSNKKLMGSMVNTKWMKCCGWLCASLIVLANLILIILNFAS